MTDDSAAQVPTKLPQARSRVTNATALLDGIDGRSCGARRYRDVLDALLAQLADGPTEADMILARRAAALAVWSEDREAAMTRGEPVNGAELSTATNTLRRLLSDLGLSAPRRDRRPRRRALAGGGAA